MTSKEHNSKPLISIVVITYNSSKYVLETLESAKLQAYKNIELIISDDASLDSTIEICEEWLGRNKERFVRTKLLKSEKNKGIPANCNQGIRASKGDWVKLIAGDDVLVPECISINIELINKFPSARVLLSAMNKYDETFQEKNFVKKVYSSFPEFFKEHMTAKDQFQQLLLGNKVWNTPTAFYDRSLFSDFLFFEEYPLNEDYPMWLNLTRSGIRLYYFDKTTVKYRMHSDSVYSSTKKLITKPSYFLNYEIRKRLIYPYVNHVEVLRIETVYWYSILLKPLNLKSDNSFHRFIYHLFIRFLNPFSYLSALLRVLNYKRYK